MKNWIARKQSFGDYHDLMRELEAENHEDFQSCTRLEPAMFRELLDRIEPRTKQTTNMRTPLESGVKLAKKEFQLQMERPSLCWCRG